MEPDAVIAFAADDGRVMWRRSLGVHREPSPPLPMANGWRLRARRQPGGRVASHRWRPVCGSRASRGCLAQPSGRARPRDRRIEQQLSVRASTTGGRLAWKWRTGGDVMGVSADSTTGAYYASLDNVLRGRQSRQRQSALDQGDSDAPGAAAADVRRRPPVRSDRRRDRRHIGDRRVLGQERCSGWDCTRRRLTFRAGR